MSNRHIIVSLIVATSIIIALVVMTNAAAFIGPCPQGLLCKQPEFAVAQFQPCVWPNRCVN